MVTQIKREMGWKSERRWMWFKCLVTYIGLIGIAGIFVVGEGLGSKLSERHTGLLLAQQANFCYCKLPEGKIVWMPASTCKKRGGRCGRGSR
ncbi:MAG: hypothetical protein ACP5U1_04460 [Desulfomonilaceae bacterium]